MTTLSGYVDAGQVRHRLALGLNFVDTVRAAPLLGDVNATVERVGARILRMAMMTKRDGAAIALTPPVAAMFRGAPNSVVDVDVAITPKVWPVAPLPRNRAILPRRLRLPLARDENGVPAAQGDNFLGRWVFTIALHRGPVALSIAGATIVAGRIVWPGGGAEPVRWAHVTARLGNNVLLGTTRSDDRGEFALPISGSAGQTPELVSVIQATLSIAAPAAPPDPAALAADPFADVPIEEAGGGFVAAADPPAGYVVRAGPTLPVAAGRVTQAGTLVFSP